MSSRFHIPSYKAACNTIAKHLHNLQTTTNTAVFSIVVEVKNLETRTAIHRCTEELLKDLSPNIHLAVYFDGQAECWGFITRLQFLRQFTWLQLDTPLVFHRDWFKAEVGLPIHPLFEFYNKPYDLDSLMLLNRVERALALRLDMYRCIHPRFRPSFMTPWLQLDSNERLAEDHLGYFCMCIVIRTIPLREHHDPKYAPLELLWKNLEMRISEYRLNRCSFEQLALIFPSMEAIVSVPEDIQKDLDSIYKGADVWYRLPFEHAISYVADRSAYLHDGWAYITESALIAKADAWLSKKHDSNLNASLKYVHMWMTDERTKKLRDKTLNSLVLLQGDHLVAKDGCTMEQLQVAMPKCMRAATIMMTDPTPQVVKDIEDICKGPVPHLKHTGRIMWFDYMLKNKIGKDTIQKLIHPHMRKVYADKFESEWKSIVREILGAEKQLVKQQLVNRSFYGCMSVMLAGMCPHWKKTHKENEKNFAAAKMMCSKELMAKTGQHKQDSYNAFQFTQRVLHK